MFDDRLKRLREAKKITQKQAAEELKINPRTYASYENNEREPNSEILVLIAKTYNVSIDYLLGMTENSTIDSKSVSLEKYSKKTGRFQEIINATTTEDLKVLSIYKLLDPEDKAEIRGEIKGMLKADKYKKG
jgi:transcriptional regulator with XRE-family HTH domain